MNLLLIGALPPPVGGTTVLFKQLVDDLRTSDGLNIRVIDVSRPTVGGLHNICPSLPGSVMLVSALGLDSHVSDLPQGSHYVRTRDAYRVTCFSAPVDL
jgi:hypothetical protein